MESPLVCSTRAIKGVPIFPARMVEKPAFFKMCSTKDVVVVFPFEPVIPIRRPPRKRLHRNSNGFGIILANENTLLPQFQGRQREQRKHQRRDPEPHDYFRFAPAKQLEMMVDGRHSEDALATQLE